MSNLLLFLITVNYLAAGFGIFMLYCEYAKPRKLARIWALFLIELLWIACLIVGVVKGICDESETEPQEQQTEPAGE